tara:strand:- start:629 stop:805 length:177 start_codon:yes stop_codon:yes gene_type:complete
VAVAAAAVPKVVVVLVRRLLILLAMLVGHTPVVDTLALALALMAVVKVGVSTLVVAVV